jgi:hypothetical protein
LQHALAVIPVFSLFAAGFFVIASRSYESDMRGVAGVSLAPTIGVQSPAVAAA